MPEQFLVRPSRYDCRQCPLSECRKHIVDGAGSLQASLFILGEAPGAEEDMYGVPFIGKSGQLLRATLAVAGYPDGTFYSTNAVKCHPEKNRNPTPDELRECSGWLIAELVSSQARVVLALGKFAQQVIEQHRDVLGDKIVRHAYHPAFILRSPRNRLKWEQDIHDACTLARGEIPIGLPTAKPWTQGQPDLSAEWLAIDTETDDLVDGVGVRRVAYTVSDGTTASFTESGVFPVPEAAGRSVVMHNAKYDAPLLGIDLDRYDKWECSLLAAYVLRFPLVGLKEITPGLCGMRLRNIRDILGTGKKAIPFSRALIERRDEAVDYASEDAVATARNAKILFQRLSASPAQERYYREIEKPAVRPLYDLERRGVLVDPDALVKLGKVLEARIAENTNVQYLMLGCPDEKFKRSSTMQLADALIGDGYVLTQKTEKTDRWKLDEVILSKLALEEGDKDSPVKRELAIRKDEKLNSTYVLSLLSKKDRDNRVHGRYNQAVAGTNRLSSSDPNLQNIPIRGAIGKTIRRMFKARPGYTFVKADASQLEVRVYAEYTRELVLLEAYLHDQHDSKLAGGQCSACDVHQQVADALGIERWRAKNTLFAAIYGAEAAKLAQTAGVSVEDTGRFLDLLRVRMPSLLTWQKTVAAKLTGHGYIDTLLGWRNYYPLFASPIARERKEALREAANCPIQGTGAGIIKVIMSEVDRNLAPRYEAELVLTVHDEVGYEVPDKNVLAFGCELAIAGRDIAKRWMPIVPFAFDVQAGLNWGDTTPLEAYCAA